MKCKIKGARMKSDKNGKVTTLYPDGTIGHLEELTADDKMKYNAEKYSWPLWWFVPDISNPESPNKWLMHYPGDINTVELI